MKQIIPLNQIPLNIPSRLEKLECNETIRRRMLDLGLVPGTKIVPILKSPSGNPTAYEVRGSMIAIRKEDSKSIYVTI